MEYGTGSDAVDVEMSFSGFGVCTITVVSAADVEAAGFSEMSFILDLS